MVTTQTRCLVTACSALRCRVFTERWIVTEVTSHLFQSAALCECAVLAYCVMPDHLHALVEARSARADFEALMRGLTRARRSIWQPGFHKRRLRDDEASDTVARYILENPVRAGLTQVVGEYPFAWSDVYDLERLFMTTNTRRRGCTPSGPATRSPA
jgi:putative transposase